LFCPIFLSYLEIWGRVFYGINNERRIKGKSCEHAEISALNKLKKYNTIYKSGKGRKRKKFYLLVIRVSKTGVIGISKPCKHCLIEINKSGLISEIGYSNKDGKIVNESIKDIKSDHITLIRSININ